MTAARRPQPTNSRGYGNIPEPLFVFSNPSDGRYQGRISSDDLPFEERKGEWQVMIDSLSKYAKRHLNSWLEFPVSE